MIFQYPLGLLAFIWLRRVKSFEIDTPLPSTVTLSQPFSFTWCRDNSDKPSAYLQFGAFYKSNSLAEPVFNVGESTSGAYTMTPTLPGEFELNGWSGYAANGENALQIGLLPHTVFVQTAQAQLPGSYGISLPPQTQSSPSQATQTESPPKTSTQTENGSGTSSLPEGGSQTLSSPSSAPKSGGEAIPSNSSTDSKRSDHTGAIVGGVIGALVATIILVALLLCIRRGKQGPHVLAKTRVTIPSNIIGCGLTGNHHSQDIVARPLSPSDYPNTRQKSSFFSARQFISAPRDQKLGEALRLPSTQSLSGRSRDAESEEEIPPQFRARFQEMSQRVARLEAEIEMPPTYNAADEDANRRQTQ
ncbi:hypothetical protein AAF712_014647 [Marasmius tenuissimus]|uniref:Uncharacterized protein n=1 Tax=Marasmius tenuissimus TaxID=585030 RepID=A0ABR2ZCN7_9AGAR